jgi:hypothetical protein
MNIMAKKQVELPYTKFINIVRKRNISYDKILIADRTIDEPIGWGGEQLYRLSFLTKNGVEIYTLEHVF